MFKVLEIWHGMLLQTKVPKLSCDRGTNCRNVLNMLCACSLLVEVMSGACTTVTFPVSSSPIVQRGLLFTTPKGVSKG